MRKLTATLCLTLCTCLFATSAFAKTVHLGCNGLNEFKNQLSAEISINYESKKIDYVPVQSPENAFTSDAIFTGKTISFENVRVDMPESIMPGTGMKTNMKSYQSWKINRRTLEITFSSRIEHVIGDEVNRIPSSPGTLKCELIETRENKI